MSVELPSVIKLISDAALSAASVALLRRQQGLKIIKKPDGSLLSSGDYQSQQIIEAQLKKISPEIARSLGVEEIDFLMEETMDGKKHDFAGRNKGAHWVVDPIDGTYGYTRKNGEIPPQPWAISIGLELDGKTIAAVVYEAAANEYGVSAEDFDSIKPEKPQGNIFWAHKDEAYAHKISGGFTVTEPPDLNSACKQTTAKNGLLILGKVPEFKIDYSAAQDNILNKDIEFSNTAKPIIGDQYLSKIGKQEVTKRYPGVENQEYLRNNILKLKNIDNAAYDNEYMCWSAVSGAMRAADGRAGIYMSGCFPWDASAARLILEKSGTNFREYEIPNSPERRSLLVAGRDNSKFKAICNFIDGIPEIASTQEKKGFLGTIKNTVNSWLAAIGLVNAQQNISSNSNSPNNPASASGEYVDDKLPEIMQTLPDNVEKLIKLPDQEKIMLAACTASGCDAVAYYTPDGKGGFQVDKIIQMYPDAHYAASGGASPLFANNIAAYNPNTYKTAEQTLANKQYHIPIPLPASDGKDSGEIKAIMVLHAPERGFGRLQDSVNYNPADFHEPVSCRMAKLQMAEHIVDHHQHLLGGKLHAILAQRNNASTENTAGNKENISKDREKIEFFQQILADQKKIIVENKDAVMKDSDQERHVSIVTEFMDLVAEKILNKDANNPLAAGDKKELIHVLTELHDIGKAQMSSSFMRPWQQGNEQEIKERQKYFVEQNHNHPLFTLLTLLMYPAEAKMSASHHHGLFRYSSDQLSKELGADFAKYTILKDNMKPEEISPLSYMMRICDVTSAIICRGLKGSGNKTDIASILQEMAERSKTTEDGKAIINPDSFHPDYLCLMIKNCVFEAYAAKYSLNSENLSQVQQKILEKFGWTKEKSQEKEDILLKTIAQDSLLAKSPSKIVDNGQSPFSDRISPSPNRWSLSS